MAKIMANQSVGMTLDMFKIELASDVKIAEGALPQNGVVYEELDEKALNLAIALNQVALRAQSVITSVADNALYVTVEHVNAWDGEAGEEDPYKNMPRAEVFGDKLAEHLAKVPFYAEGAFAKAEGTTYALDPVSCKVMKITEEGKEVVQPSVTGEAKVTVLPEVAE